VTCEHCGGNLTKPRRGPMPRYCSASCRARACTARAAADGRLARWNATRAARLRVDPTDKTCPYCGAMFETTRPTNDLTCGSKSCRRAHQRQRVIPYVDHRRRVVRAGEIFDRFEIFERDGWRCGICGEHVDSALEHPHPLSASIDHVVPLGRGGEHRRSNVRCAHLICNNRRGIRDDRELDLAPPQAQAA
jgi:5-methylcytosine-specific restriction endonuclease McrA